MTPGKLPPELETFTLSELLAEPAENITWLIEPFIPAGGIIFFHGPTSVGKSPFTWQLSLSIATGADFFGYTPATTGMVLYLELDTPKPLIKGRLAKLESRTQNLRFAIFDHTINILDLNAKDRARLTGLQAHLRPVLVVINTLRKVHMANDKDSDVPAKVYSGFRSIFPTAALLFVHHDKKPISNGMLPENPDYGFSGSQHWMDDAQVALHITRLYSQKKEVKEGEEPPKHEKTRVSVKMTKSQVSDHEGHPPLILQLSPDGTNWLETGPSAYRRYFRALGPEMKRMARIKLTMEHFQVGQSTIYDAVKGLE